ncbi:VanW family protein [Lysinibacillus sp. MHQ-1]|nr:VanW family protein [Lysinibacillus sp. MHQ-1]
MSSLVVGTIFSFNTMVGPRDEANGYQPAPEIINKKSGYGHWWGAFVKLLQPCLMQWINYELNM